MMGRALAWVLILPSLALAQLPSPAATARLSRSAGENAAGVLLVGDPSRGQGTAFVISREHRLAATAAHVADLFRGPGTVVAVVNGSMQGHRVTRVWYHPALRRTLAPGLVVRSPDPADGPVFVPGPDLAVIELEAGADLPREWTLAGPDRGGPLQKKPVALLGYPGYGGWPSPGRPAVATLHAGVVRNHDAFSFSEGSHPDRRQLIEHSAATPEGSSGSPVFAPDGLVIGVHNILRLDGSDGSAEAGMSVRVDALWELLRFHGLQDKLPAASRRWDVLIPSAPAADPRLPDYRRAVGLVREAESLAARNDHRGAGQKCNAAVNLAPEYASAYIQRCRSFTGYVGTYWKTLPVEEKRRQANWAIEDAKTGFLLAPESLEGLCLLIQDTLYLGLLDGDRSAFREAIEGADEMLSLKHLSPRDRGFLTNCRAQARHYLGDFDGALRDYSDSIRIAPAEPVWYANRAQFYDHRGRPDLAALDRQQAETLVRGR